MTAYDAFTLALGPGQMTGRARSAEKAETLDGRYLCVGGCVQQKLLAVMYPGNRQMPTAREARGALSTDIRERH